MFIPFPNVIAGLLIRFADHSWPEIFASAAGWSIVWAIFQWMVDPSQRNSASRRFSAPIEWLREHGRWLVLGSAAATHLRIELFTAFLTALPVAAITYGVRAVF
jgi:hypothetical protein